MSYDERKLCVMCAWRGTCNLKYSMPGGVALHCTEFTRDVTLKEPEEEIRKRNVLIVGPREIGKTTLVRTIQEQLGRNTDGYYTRSVRGGWFRPSVQELVLFSGGVKTLATSKVAPGWVRLGTQYVDVKLVEETLVPLLRRAIDSEHTELIVLDEVSKLQCVSESFRQRVVDCITSHKNVLATVSVGDQDDDFLHTLESRSDVTTFHMGYDNRDQLVERIQFMLASRPGPSSIKPGS